MNKPGTERAKAGKGERKKPKFLPYKVQIGGKTFWQVNLESESITRADGSIERVRPRRTFSSAEEARAFAQLKRVERTNRGTLGVSMDDRLRADALEAQKILEPYQLSLVNAARECALRRQRLRESQSVSFCVQSLLEAKAADHLRPRYLKDLRNRLEHFAGEFGNRLVADITSEQIDRWLRSLAVGPLTRNSYHLRLNLLFGYARERGWTETNPLSAVRKTKVPATEPGILEPQEIARLLEAAAESTVPYWAIAAFAGLRSAELGRLSWRDIDWQERLVEVPALSSKTASRRFVRIQPNLALWLEPYRDCHGPLCPPNWRKRLEKDRANAGITKWPVNCLRHGFGSYHLAFFRDAKDLALEMGHTRADTVFRFYHRRTKPALAEEFWRIVPAVDANSKLAALA
jgi:integrase